MKALIDLSLLRSSPSVSPFSIPHHQLPPRSRKPFKLRCSLAEGPTISSSKIDGGESSIADCVVVGGGISGLCIAQALATKHRDVASNVIVTEARDRVGGNITTVERDGYLWEEGPNSFQPSDPILTMAVDSGLKDDLVLGDPNAPRFVLWEGKLRPVPSKPTDLPFFDLMSIAGKLRAGFGAIGIRPPPPGYEESVEEFVRRNLGAEVFERFIEPFCSGVYAGDPSKLSMKAAFGRVWKLEEIGGSIIGGTFKTIQERNKTPKPPRDPRLPKPKGQTVGSFRKGLTMLPEAIANRWPCLYNSFSLCSGSKLSICFYAHLYISGMRVLISCLELAVWAAIITKLGNGGYNLTFETPEGMVSLQSRSVVMTIPSHVASNLLHPLSAAAADALSQFYYPPVASVTVSYPKEAIRKECLIDGELKGFGQLHPRSQGIETLGTIYSSSLFPNRAPSGRVLLLNYIGGATNTGILSKDPLVLGVRVWPKAIPQFLVGHLDLLDTAKMALRDSGFHGLFLGGNYVSGVALGRCVEGAYEVAAEVKEFLSRYAYK
ncbi:protoporphyrinogen oxidase 1, chloroplastic-like [Gossypium australe]|uniref:Protoporphyrinogen oxidase n=1 Tax=Gossypium australe TaxID=47621 RepID=A0A5B6W1I6_9ROSI|nr:protoporphyrinogen oxidase 1, chloroplastic-like [Gossypium australe]